MSAVLLALLLAPPDPAAYREAVERYLRAAEDVADLTDSAASGKRVAEAVSRATVLYDRTRDSPRDLSKNVGDYLRALNVAAANCEAIASASDAVLLAGDVPGAKAAMVRRGEAAALTRQLISLARVRLYVYEIAALGGAPALAGAMAAAMPAAVRK